MKHSIARPAWLLGSLFAIVLLSTRAAFAAPPPMLLANVLGPDVDVSLYLVSEKYDGVRAQWDGQTLRFRSGRPVAAPAWFTAQLPAVSLDGELWIGRGRFDEVSGIVRKAAPVDEEWRRVNYMIFELVLPENSARSTFAERADQIKQIVARANAPFLTAVRQYTVKDRQELKRELHAVVKAGGEGLMLHRADAPYLTGRSDALLKLKPLLDTEATVVAHIAGKGKHTGQMGALLLETDNGIRFKLGTGFSDATRANPPPIGARVTYTYRDVTPSGKPRFASFLRIREDM